MHPHSMDTLPTSATLFDDSAATAERPVAQHDVYAALTTDYGVAERHPEAQAANVLDLNGLLHVEQVPKFIAALTAWQANVAAHRAGNSARRAAREKLRAVVDRSAGTPNRAGRPLSPPSPTTLHQRCWMCGSLFESSAANEQRCSRCAA